MKIKMSDIKIKKRIREEIGDLSNLKQSMEENGLINPITINNKKELLAGYRRYSAAIELGWYDIECKIIETKSKWEKLRVEIDENVTRKDFTQNELSKMEEIRKYYTAKGFEKIKLFFLYVIKTIKELIKKIFDFIKNLFS